MSTLASGAVTRTFPGFQASDSFPMTITSEAFIMRLRGSNLFAGWPAYYAGATDTPSCTICEGTTMEGGWEHSYPLIVFEPNHQRHAYQQTQRTSSNGTRCHLSLEEGQHKSHLLGTYKLAKTDDGFYHVMPGLVSIEKTNTFQ